MVDAQLPKDLWPKAYKATIYILNWTPTHFPNQDKPELEWTTPVQQLQALTMSYIERLNLANMCVYGCCAYVKCEQLDIGS